MDDETTPLDRAHALMQAAPEDEAARMRFYERLADGELFLLLAEEATDDEIAPQVFPVDGGTYVLVFDREARLAAFSGRIAPYAALSGRNIAGLLAGQGMGLAVNLGAPSAILIPEAAVGWLAETLGPAPEEVTEVPEEVSRPTGLPDRLIEALDTKLAQAGGLAKLAYLAGVTYRGGRPSHMLALVDAVPGAEPALAQAVGEALRFSGIEAGVLDVAFFRAADPVCARLARVGLRFDLPQVRTASVPGSAPGMDPSKPPRLR